MVRRSTSFVPSFSLALALSLSVVGGACSTFGSSDDAPPTGDASSAPLDASSAGLDATTIADAAPCDLTGPWSTPMPLAAVNGLPATTLGIPSPDELTLFIVANADNDRQGVYVSFRTSVNEDFTTPSALPGGLNGSLPYYSLHPSISVSGTELYYERKDGIGSTLYRSTRPTLTADFPEGSSVAGMQNSPRSPLLTRSGLSLYFSNDDLKGNLSDLYVATRATTSDQFTASTRVAILSSLDVETYPVPSADELTLYFARAPSAGGKSSVWMASRASTTASFGTPRPVPELSSDDENLPTGLSADGCRIYLTTKTPPGNYVIRVARRP
jgi:hypothetical protein